MTIKDFEIGFCVVYFIFCLDGVDQGLKLYQCTVFLFDEDDFGYLAEVREDIV